MIVVEKIGEVVDREWNFEIRKKSQDYYGYELKVEKKPTESFAYVHKLEGSMKATMADAMGKVGLKKIVKPSSIVIIKVNLCGGFYKILASQTPLKAIDALTDELMDIVDNRKIFSKHRQKSFSDFFPSKKNGKFFSIKFS